MQDNNGNKNTPESPRPGGSGRPGGDSNFNWKGMILISIALGILALAFMHKTTSGKEDTITYSRFKELVETDRIVSAEENNKQRLKLVNRQGSTFIKGFYKIDKPIENEGKEEQAFKTQVDTEFHKDEIQAVLAAKDLELEEVVTESDSTAMILLTWLPLLLIMLVFFLILRNQFRSAGKGAMNFGKSKAKLMAVDKNKVTFKNVAGADEAKEEVWEIVEFLRDPKKFQRLGGQIPKGCLMVGPPGTGKTLLARAIAGEADVPFFSISGSDFVEMFVGVGASRVRDMFEQGRKSAPCLIFIDEIDAVGRHRGHGLGGGHDEREQTLNALLVEMDGFDTQEGVIIIAATNRPDVLDPALLRPGRFDRQVSVGLPDVKGRAEILRVHAKKVKLAEGVDMMVIARGTPGFSGAELANLLNEAALLAARKGLKAITINEMEEARDKVRWGKERRSLAISEKEKENTAYHEAGHALLGMLVDNTDPVHKVTIIPRGPSLGSTMYLPAEDHLSYRKNYLLDKLVIIMGGRVAEEIVFKDVTIGASGDIKQATNIARKMICEWGMSEELGMIEYGDGEDQVFLARDISSPRNYSEATAQKIDNEVKSLIDTAYQRATDLIVEHRKTLNLIAEALLEYETLDGSHCQDLLDKGEMSDPPATPTPPALPDGDDKKESKPEKEEATGDDLPPDMAPAGA